ncbi:MAG: cyclic nucleotide-binding domain-containing protein [Bdellovibrionaceae bacterium]|nr:cyclic nucleotide-binding domain-containing protein [Pseudobdellovibrionaceae bacterium]
MLRIESQPMTLKPVPVDFGPLSEAQTVYLKMLKEGQTITQCVDDLLAEGRLVSFTEMYDLVEKLHRASLIQNPLFKNFFQKLSDHAKPGGKPGMLTSLFKKEKPDEYLRRHPFFRSQNPVITALFCQHAEVIEAKPGTMICQAGHLERDLFFMIDGEAAIYKNIEGQGRRLLGFLGKGAVIGEVGFFMGELRTADVVVTKAAKFVAIRYDEAAFGRIINKDIARNLQIRFRVVHALAKSPFLKNIPEEALDSLAFAGQVRDAKEFDVLCRENELGDRCFVVINGSVVISRGTKNVGVLGPGEVFGEIALFFTEGRRTATAMAQRDTMILEIKAQDFYKLLGRNLLLGKEFEKLALERAGKIKQAA